MKPEVTVNITQPFQMKDFGSFLDREIFGNSVICKFNPLRQNPAVCVITAELCLVIQRNRRGNNFFPVFYFAFADKESTFSRKACNTAVFFQKL